DVHQRALARILADAGRIARAEAKPGDPPLEKITILAENYWVRQPLLYLTRSMPGVDVIDYQEARYGDGYDPQKDAEFLRGCFAIGVYAVGFAEDDGLIRANVGSTWPSDQVERWSVPLVRPGTPSLAQAKPLEVYHKR